MKVISIVGRNASISLFIWDRYLLWNASQYGNAVQEKNFQNNDKFKLFNYIPRTIKLTIISSHKKWFTMA